MLSMSRSTSAFAALDEPSLKKANLQKSSVVAYGLILFLASCAYHPAVVTCSALVQCCATALLVSQTLSSGSTAGISANALILDALALIFRLAGTVWLDGYLPVDWTGDWLYQAIDMCSLVMVLWLLHDMFVLRPYARKTEVDVFPTGKAIIVCLVLGTLLHANMDDHPFYDMLWMAGLMMSVVAVMPQYNLILKTGGLVEPLISHYIAAMAVSKILAGLYMWWARFDIECDFWMENVNHAVLTILGVHFLHLVFLADFAYYYIKTIFTRGLGSRLELPMYNTTHV